MKNTNLIAYCYVVNDYEIHYYVTAKSDGESKGEFVILTDLNEHQAELSLDNGLQYGTLFLENTVPNRNGFAIDTMTNVKKGVYTKLIFKKTVLGVHGTALMHVVEGDMGRHVETKQINSLRELPDL